ncbi:hypothetical protein PoB_000574300 [Plakobranchus ocellatus]|uniref:Uncharacterized protein n=1 Tax=Plakobranchus ocellatus TaxID=259542 RepID=A0AAV3YAR8_9GAST|nr:hypothetical protein PoB_000574300 [Plakobranchus ocellatus]
MIRKDREKRGFGIEQKWDNSYGEGGAKRRTRKGNKEKVTSVAQWGSCVQEGIQLRADLKLLGREVGGGLELQPPTEVLCCRF